MKSKGTIAVLLFFIMLVSCTNPPPKPVPQDTIQPTITVLPSATPTKLLPSSSPTATVTVTVTPVPEKSAEEIKAEFLAKVGLDDFVTDNNLDANVIEVDFRKFTDVNGETFAIITLGVDPEKLSPEQTDLKITPHHYLVSKDGAEFTLLNSNLDINTITNSAIEFSLTAEYQQGLQQYLHSMSLTPENVMVDEVVKVVNNKKYRFLVVIPDVAKLTPEQEKYLGVFSPYPLFGQNAGDTWQKVNFKDLVTGGKIIGTSIVWKLAEQLSYSGDIPKSTENYKALIKSTNAMTIKTNWYDYQPEEPVALKFRNISLQWGLNQLRELDLDPDFSIRAQELLYYITAPDWIRSGNFSKEEMRSFFEKYLTEVIQHFAGKVKEWIVVNEPYGGSGPWAPYRDDPFYKVMKEDYILEAFRIARKADPSAILIYNDTGNHASSGTKGGETTDISQKRVKILKQEGLIDRVGIQMHLYDHSIPDKEDIITTFRSYGVPVVITELDVDMSRFSGSDEEKSLRQAEIYRIVVEACMESGVCEGITFWEPGDAYNWREVQSGDKADASFLDDDLNPKAAYFAMISELFKQLP